MLIYRTHNLVNLPYQFVPLLIYLISIKFYHNHLLSNGAGTEVKLTLILLKVEFIEFIKFLELLHYKHTVLYNLLMGENIDGLALFGYLTENIDRWHLDNVCELWSFKILEGKNSS